MPSSTSSPVPLRAVRLVLAAGAATLAAGCAGPKPAVPVDPHAKVVQPVAVGDIRMPQGVDLDRLKLIEQLRRPKIYAEVIGRSDVGREKLLFNDEMGRALGLTDRQVTRRFIDTVARSRRFEIYDSTASVTAEQSDYVVDAQVTSATQELVPIEGGLRVSRTRVRLSVQLKNRYTGGSTEGEPMFDKPVEVVGETGLVTNDRVVLRASESQGDPAVQRRLGVDYERALQRAFDGAAERIESVLRPLGKVVSVEGRSVGILGGIRHGLQGDDELVVFRAKVIRVGGRDAPASTRAVAVIRCDGVGSATSQCDVIRQHPDFRPQEGDFAVLSDHSAHAVPRVN